LCILDIKINEIETRIINIYGLNADNTIVLNDLQNHLSPNTDIHVIIGGDFNTIFDPTLDKLNDKRNTHNKCRHNVKRIIQTYKLINTWRHKHPTTKWFTWHSNTKPTMYCRLGYFLISDQLMNSVKTIQSSFRSDHSVVLLELHVNTNNIE